MRSGFDRATVDDTIRPQDDLFGHVNNTWLREVEIPADRGRYGTFDVLRENAEHHVREIIEEVAAGAPEPGTVAAKVGDLYASFMAEEAIEALGHGPVDARLGEIAALTETAALPALLGALAREGIPTAFHPYVNTDDRDPTRYVVYLEQGGLGLPDEAYYREPAHEAVRAAYVDHVCRMLTLVGRPTPRAGAEAVMALETRLAAAHNDTVSNRDPVKTYTLLDRAGLEDLTPGLDWGGYLRALSGGSAAGAGALDAVVVRQPAYLTELAAALREEPLEAWQAWVTWHLLHGAAPYLCAAFVEENFDFYGRTLSGVPEMRDRWKRGVTLVEGALGEAVGQLYVERHFPARAKERMHELVGNLVQAFRADFEDLPWMSSATRDRALAKLEQFTPKIGCPDRWKDYSAVEVTPEDLLGNVRRANAAETDRELAKLGGPIDRDEWFMTPQTVNAYYNPGMNEIVFPAAILQPPFFDVDADDAVNYGGIGAVIGHEIGHGFDDQGSQYDGTGTLHNWWTDEDRAQFSERAGRLIAQFDGLESRDAPGTKINGALTVGENIGDLCGLAIGHAAYRLSTGGSSGPELDGWTGDQRFFLGWAQIWRGRSRRAEAERLLAVDPHAPIDVRGNVVRNIDAFHDAFQTAPGDGLWLDPQDRVHLF